MKTFQGIKSLDNSSLTFERASKLLSGACEIIDCLAVSISSRGNEKIGNEGRVGLSRRYGFVLCGSVQLFNREDICQALHIEREQAVHFLDLDLVLESYVNWGIKSFGRFIGNFSCLIWDERKKVCICVVDHLGIFSLYYRIIKGGIFCFSNRLRNLTQMARGSIDDEYLLAYLLNCYQDTGKTVYRDISTIPPGCYLKILGESVEVHRYWRPVVNTFLERNRSSEGSVGAARDLLIEAVANRVSTNQINGILLSGGLDSSAIGSIVNSILNRSDGSLIAFSKVLKPGNKCKEKDERDYIRTITDRERIPVKFISDVSFTDKNALHEYFCYQACFPLNPFIFLSRPLYQMAASSGCTTIFSGFGGDETLSTEGLNSLPLLLKYFCWHDFLENSSALAKRYNLRKGQVFRRFVLQPVLPDVFLQFFQRIKGLGEDRSLGNGLVIKEILFSPFASTLLASKYGYTSDDYLDPRQELCSRLTSSYFRPFFDHSEYLEDILGVTQVFPFLDIRIINFMLSVHPRELVKEGMTRSVLRRSTAGLIPEEIRLRKDKIPFNVGVPFFRCLLESRPLFEEIIHNSQSLAWQLIDRELLREKFSELQMTEGRRGRKGDNRLALEIGRCINVAAFCQWNGV